MLRRQWTSYRLSAQFPVGVSCEKLELVSLGAVLFPSFCLFTRVFIIRSSCEASLMVTWPLHAHTHSLKCHSGEMERGTERKPRERETESLLAAMLKVCSSYSVEWEAPFSFTFPHCLCFIPTPASLSPSLPLLSWFQVTGLLRVKQDCTLGNSPCSQPKHTHLPLLYTSLSDTLLTHSAFHCRPH